MIWSGARNWSGARPHPTSCHRVPTQKLPGATVALASQLGADPCWFLASLCSSTTSPPPIVRDDDWHDDTSFKTQTLLHSMILVVSESAAWRKRMFATPWLAMALHFLFCKVFKKKVFWSNQRFCLLKQPEILSSKILCWPAPPINNVLFNN